MSTTLNLSDKFSNDLNRFFIWANENNYVVKKDDEIIDWSQNILPDFIEPSRNKINAYVKDLFQFYKLYDKNNLQIEETFIKIIIKEFKENKPTLKKSKKNETNETNEIADDIQNANREPKETNKRKYTKRSIKNTKENTKQNLKTQTDSGISCSESDSERLEEKVDIKMSEIGIKLVHKNWDISINENVINVMSIIEYIGNHKDEIIAEIKKQQMNDSGTLKEKLVEKQKVDDSKIPKQKKEKVIKKQKVNESKMQENLELEKQKVNEPKMQENLELEIQKVNEPKIQEKIESKMTNWADSTVIEPESPDLVDEFGEITLDDIEF